MAGPDASALIPTDVKLHQVSRVLELVFADGRRFRLPYEFLRVSSPSAEVRGHGPGQETLQTGKREVTITAIEPVGHYAVRPTFSDGHFDRHLLVGIPARSLRAAGRRCGATISRASRPPTPAATRSERTRMTSTMLR